MTVKQRGVADVRALPVGVGAGMLVSLVITIVLSSIMGWMISGERLVEGSVNFGALAIQFLSSIVGTWAAFALVKSKRLLVCMVSGCGYFLLLLVCTALFFGGQYQGVGLSAVAILAGSLIVLLLGLKGDKRKSVIRRKIKNR